MAYLGTNLLDRTTVRLLARRRYGLIGRNGVGKSTLMRRIASGTLPGFPHHLRVAQVQQELPVVDESAPMTPVEYILANDPVRKVVLRKIDQIENDLSDSEESESESDGEINTEKLEAEANFLQSLYDLLEDENVVKARAVRILKDLGFNATRRDADMREMSGGWRIVRTLGFQIRYRYELAPLSYLYVVYGRGGYRQDPFSDAPDALLRDSFDLRDDEQLLVKLSYRFEL